MRRDGAVGPHAGEPPRPSRLRVLGPALLVAAMWGVALDGLGAVFAPGRWQLLALGAVAATLLVPALVRVAAPDSRLGACLAGLAVALPLALAPAFTSGRVSQWWTDPGTTIGWIRVTVVTGDAPVAVNGGLLDILLLACVALSWASALLVVGLDAGILAGLLPASLLLVGPVVLAVRVGPGEVLAVAVLVLALAWAQAPPRRGRWRGAVAALAALGLAAGVLSVVPVTRDRLWNTTGASLSPVSGDVPDVTVALGEDLRQGPTAEVFRYTGRILGTPMRFPLAVLRDLDGGVWKPLSDTDSTLAEQPRRSLLLPGDVSLFGAIDRAALRESQSTRIEISGLVSSWLPLPMDAIEVLPAGSGASTDLDLGRWTWVQGTQTVRSTTSLTSRRTSYVAVGIPWLVALNRAGGDRSGIGELGLWPVSVVPPGAASTGSSGAPAGGASPAGTDDATVLASALAPYTELPGGVPADITDTARTIVAGSGDRYTAALHLAQWFTTGTFAYDEAAPWTPGTDPADPYSVIEAFLATRRGYCVHFASTFTVMARSLGMPARVVVGYASRTRSGWTSVTARNLHAWPEVYFEGLGWVAFEPTPGGAGFQADTGSWAVSPAETGPSPTPDGTATGGAVPSVRPTTDPRDVGGVGAGGEGGAGTTPVLPDWARGVLTVAVLALFACLAPALARVVRRSGRRRLVRRGHEGGALAAWTEMRDTALDLGWVVTPDRWREEDSAGPGGVASWSRRPRARTPEAVVEHLVSIGALDPGGAAAARRIAEATVLEVFSRGHPPGSPGDGAREGAPGQSTGRSPGDGARESFPDQSTGQSRGRSSSRSSDLSGALDVVLASLQRRAASRPGGRRAVWRARLAPVSLRRRR